MEWVIAAALMESLPTGEICQENIQETQVSDWREISVNALRLETVCTTVDIVYTISLCIYI